MLAVIIKAANETTSLIASVTSVVIILQIQFLVIKVATFAEIKLSL